MTDSKTLRSPRTWEDTRTLVQLIEVQRVTHRMAMRSSFQAETHAAQCFWLKQAGVARRMIAYYRGTGPHPYAGLSL